MNYDGTKFLLIFFFFTSVFDIPLVAYLVLIANNTLRNCNDCTILYIFYLTTRPTSKQTPIRPRYSKS